MADVFQVDFDTNGVSEFANLFTAADGSTVTAGTNHSYASGLGVGGNITVTRTNSGRMLRRSPVTGTGLDEVAMDFLWESPQITIGVLKAGVYELTNYMHVQSTTTQDATISIGDALGSTAVRDQMTGSTGSTPGTVKSSTNLIVSDGVNPIALGTTGSINAVTLTETAMPTALNVKLGDEDIVPMAGYQLFKRGRYASIAPPLSRPFAVGFGAGGGVGVSVTTSAGNISTRSNRNGGGANVIEGLWFDVAGDMLMTLSGLTAGTYTMTSYHYDNNLPGSTTIQINNDGVSGNDLFDNTGIDGAPMDDASLTYTATLGSPSATYRFTADGTNDVVFTFSGNGAFNGFELTKVPEPATMGLLGLGFAGLAALRRRRR